MPPVPDPNERTHLSLTEADVRLIRAIGVYRYMSALDLAHLLYAPSSISYVRQRLSRLAGGGDHIPNQYLLRLGIPQTSRGNTLRVYCLGAKGLDFITNVLRLEDADRWYRPYKMKHRSFSFMRHSLLLTRFVCCAEYFCTTNPDFILAQPRLCYELSRSPLRVSVTLDRKTTPVIPDALLCFERVSDGVRFPIIFEADCGSEASRAFRHHISARLSCLRSPQYSSMAGTHAGRIVYVTIGQFPSYRCARLRAMRSWTMEVLFELGLQNWASVFLFASVEYEKIYDSAQALFTEPVWFNPIHSEPVPLFDPITPTKQPATSADKENSDGDHP